MRINEVVEMGSAFGWCVGDGEADAEEAMGRSMVGSSRATASEGCSPQRCLGALPFRWTDCVACEFVRIKSAEVEAINFVARAPGIREREE